MTKLINCKIRLSKKSQEMIHSIENNNGEYIVELNKGFKFTWDSTCAIESNQKAVMETIKSIVPIEKGEENSYEHILASIDENQNVVAFENNSEIVQMNERAKVGHIVYSFLTKIDIENARKMYANYEEIISELKLDSSHYGNFENMRNGAIFGTLRRYEYSRHDLLNLIENYLYGLNTKSKSA